MLTAQKSDSITIKYNSAYIELLGNGYVYSLNYERIVLKRNKVDISARIGISYYYSLHNATYTPLSIQMYYGNKSKLEIGAGYLPIFRWDKIKEEGTVFNFDKSKYSPTSGNYIEGHDEPYADAFFMNIGYHQQLRHNLLFKISFSPWIGKEQNGYAIMPWGRVAFGKTF
jgi:hypothetical protein